MDMKSESEEATRQPGVLKRIFKSTFWIFSLYVLLASVIMLMIGSVVGPDVIRDVPNKLNRIALYLLATRLIIFFCVFYFWDNILEYAHKTKRIDEAATAYWKGKGVHVLIFLVCFEVLVVQGLPLKILGL